MSQGAQVSLEKGAAAAYDASPWAKDRPSKEIVRPAPDAAPGETPVESVARATAFRKLQSRTQAALEAVLAASTWKALPPDQQTTMLSAGGPNTGTTWTATHNSPMDLMKNAHWRMATSLRLGLVPTTENATCSLCRNTDGEQCGTSLKEQPHHPHCCKFGGARHRPHLAMQRVLHRQIVAAGGFCDLERHVPELYDTVVKNGKTVDRSAIMDAVVSFPGELSQRWVDVSVRCPHADRYGGPGGTTTAGKAASTAEQEKHKRYGGAVLPLVMESFGRMGCEGVATLRALVASGAAAGRSSPFAYARWRVQLERATLQAEADTHLRALGMHAHSAMGMATKPAAAAVAPPGLVAPSGLFAPSGQFAGADCITRPFEGSSLVDAVAPASLFDAGHAADDEGHAADDADT